jgi:hypothetical protein
MGYRKPIIFRTEDQEILTVYDPRVEGSYAHVRDRLIASEEEGTISRTRRDAYLILLDKSVGVTSRTMDEIVEATDLTDRLFGDEDGTERLFRDIREGKTG